MKVITFQSEELLNTLIIKRVVHPDINKRRFNAPNTYNHLIDDYNKKHNSTENALFYVWVRAFKDKPITEINNAVINRCNAMTPIKDNNVCLLLDVPDDIVMVTSFYNYSDEMFAETDGEIKSIWNSIYDLKNSTELQGVIPYISLDMVKDIKIIKIKGE